MNTAKGSGLGRALTDDERSAILQWNRRDEALYERVSADFDLRIRELGDITRELQSLRSTNSFYRPLYLTIESWHSRLRTIRHGVRGDREHGES